MADEWRRVAAALSDPERQRVYASVVLGVDIDLPAKRHEKALRALTDAGLISLEDDHYVAIDGAFSELLAAAPVTTRVGVERFVRDGRIVQYPVRASDQLEVLTWVRDRAVPDSDELTEREIGERLAELATDVALLRRYLVDAGLVVRAADGSRYRRAP